MRNVITINADLHADFRAKVAGRKPRLTLGDASEQAVALWMALEGKTISEAAKIVKEHVAKWRKQEVSNVM